MIFRNIYFLKDSLFTGKSWSKITVNKILVPWTNGFKIILPLPSARTYLCSLFITICFGFNNFKNVSCLAWIIYVKKKIIIGDDDDDDDDIYM